MAKSDSETSKFVKRLLESSDDDPDIDSRPQKRAKLNPVEDQIGTSALPNKNHVQERKSNSAKEQADANALTGKDQDLRHEDHRAKTVPKRDVTKPAEQKTPQSGVAAEPPKRTRPNRDRAQLTTLQSSQILLKEEFGGLTQRLEALEKHQDDAIQKAIENTLDKAVTKAVDAAKEAIAEKAAKEVEDAVTKKVARFVQAMQAETDQQTQKTARELENLRAQITRSEEARHNSEMYLISYMSKLTDNLTKESEAAIAKVKEAADQATALVEKEADQKLQDALNRKEAAESAMLSMHKDLKSHVLLLKQQKYQLERTRHQCRVSEMKYNRATHQLNRISSRIMRPSGSEDADLMDLDEAAYPSRKSDVAQQTPNSRSQSQSSTSHFTSSTSSTTNDVSTHDSKPRQGLMWSSRRNVTPFANSMPSKVSDPDNIAMENHSRKGLSGDQLHSGESDEESPTSNASRSQFHRFQSPAQKVQVTRSFGRPSAGHLGRNDQQQQISRYTPGLSSVPHVHNQRFANVLTGVGQSNSRRAPRDTTVQANYSQQHGDSLNGIDHSDFHRAAPPSHPQNAFAQSRQPPPGNNMSNSCDAPRPTPQNTRPRTTRRGNHSNDTQFSHSGYAASQLHNVGSFAQAGPAHLDGGAQSPSFHRAPQSHYQDNHQYAPSGSHNGPAQLSSTYPAPQSRYQDSSTQAVPAPFSGPVQETNFYAQSRRAADNQRNAAHNDLSSPPQGQPQQGQRGRGRGGRGGSRVRGGSRNGRGGDRNIHTMNRNQPYDADDEYDPRPVMATPRQHGADRALKPQPNPFASQGGPSPGTVIPSIGARFDEIRRTGR